MPWGWRADGDLARDVPPTRRIMPFLMRTKSQSLALFEQKVDADRVWEGIQGLRDETGLRVTPLHLVIWALARTIHLRPRLNRFTSGGRIYERRGIWISFSAKTGKTDDAPIFVVKKQIDPEWSIQRVVQEVEAGVAEGRSGRSTATDRELAWLLRLPVPLLHGAAKLVFLLDRWGLLPGWFIRGDPFFASVFVANLGSIGLDAGYHHLYEYGNIPIFLMMGQGSPEPVVRPDGQVESREVITMRYSFDERVEDALYAARALEIFRQLLEEPTRPVEVVP